MLVIKGYNVQFTLRPGGLVSANRGQRGTKTQQNSASSCTVTPIRCQKTLSNSSNNNKMKLTIGGHVNRIKGQTQFVVQSPGTTSVQISALISKMLKS